MATIKVSSNVMNRKAHTLEEAKQYAEAMKTLNIGVWYMFQDERYDDFNQLTEAFEEHTECPFDDNPMGSWEIENWNERMGFLDMSNRFGNTKIGSRVTREIHENGYRVTAWHPDCHSDMRVWVEEE